MNNLTALIITGTPLDLSNFVKGTFDNLEGLTIKQLQAKEVQPSIDSLKEYHVPTENYTSRFLTGANLRSANKYIKNRSTVKFKDIANYIKTNSSAKNPCNVSVSNFLHENNYTRYSCVRSDNTAFIVWRKTI